MDLEQQGIASRQWTNGRRRSGATGLGEAWGDRFEWRIWGTSDYGKSDSEKLLIFKELGLANHSD
jgi:hypothetical protein